MFEQMFPFSPITYAKLTLHAYLNLFLCVIVSWSLCVMPFLLSTPLSLCFCAQPPCGTGIRFSLSCAFCGDSRVSPQRQIAPLFPLHSRTPAGASHASRRAFHHNI